MVGHPFRRSGTHRIVGILLDAVNVVSVKLCLMVMLIELYPFMPLSVTLAVFQSHSGVKAVQHADLLYLDVYSRETIGTFPNCRNLAVCSVLAFFFFGTLRETFQTVSMVLLFSVCTAGHFSEISVCTARHFSEISQSLLDGDNLHLAFLFHASFADREGISRSQWPWKDKVENCFLC